MANYVVDASVVIEYLISGPQTSSAQSFFNQLTDADQLVVPEFCLLEYTNVIWKQVRFNGLSRSDAKVLQNVLLNLKLRRAPMKRLLDRSLDIALDNVLAVYDSGYIALALYYGYPGYPLVTIDQPQMQAATAESVTLISITGFNL
ncbi:MAG: type II toxin-antitoxin system VapC family toxin [Chloroflexota bacterium]